MAERAGYTVTMFLVDVSSSMGKLRQVEVSRPDGETDIIEMTNLEWSLQYVKLKIQEMVYNGRKTDQCAVVLFGSEETDNMVNKKDGGYEHVSVYIPVITPTADTIAKLSELKPTEVTGDPIDAIIVGLETQAEYLISKKSWTRKMVLLTDGENPIEIEDWEATAHKMNECKVRFILVGVDFDDEGLPFFEENKSDMKRVNEEFFHKFVEKLEDGVIGNAEFALQEISRPEAKQTKSALLGTTLRFGDIENFPKESLEIQVKISKYTAISRPKTWKKFAIRRRTDDPEDVVMKEPEDEDEERKLLYAQLGMKTKYVVEHPEDEDVDEDQDEEHEDKKSDSQTPPELIEKEDLIRGYKYGSSYVPCPDGNFPKLETQKGIEICGFITKENYRRDWAMGEVSYVWADPGSPAQQVAFSSVVRAMYSQGVFAIGRWATKDGADVKMGVLKPEPLKGETDYLFWVQMPFADDVRKYPFASLNRLVNKKGEVLKHHPYLPTSDQLAAMENLVDAMDLMEAGEKDENGHRQPWFSTELSYNPAIHRVKQAQFHAAVVTDLNKQPLPPPHPELLKYFEPPRRVLKRAKAAIEEAKAAFKVREVPKKITRSRKDEHVRARDEGDDSLLLDKIPNKKRKVSGTQTQSQYPTSTQATTSARSQRKHKKPSDESETESSETEPESDQELLLNEAKDQDSTKLPTPSRSPSASPEPARARAPGRIIGFAYPLEDFKKNIAAGDLVTKAVEDLAFVIKDIVLKPFSSRRTTEMLDCMRVLRETAGQEDEIDGWNEFLIDLKSACLDGKPGNREFWKRVCEVGRNLSLISKPEAEQLGGMSNISEVRAGEFFRFSE